MQLDKLALISIILLCANGVEAKSLKKTNKGVSSSLLLRCAKTRRLPNQIKLSQKQLIKVAGALRSGDMIKAKASYGAWYKRSGRRLNRAIVSAAKRWILRQTFLVPQKKLMRKVDGVEALRQKRKQLNKQMVLLQREKRQSIGLRNRNASPGLRNRALEQEMSNLDDRLDKLSEQIKREQLSLTQALQGESRLFQILSNAQKMMNDVEMASVRNIK